MNDNRVIVMNPIIKSDTSGVLKAMPSFCGSVQIIDRDAKRRITLLPSSLSASAFLTEYMSMLIDNEIDWLGHVREDYSTYMMLNCSSVYAEQEVPNSLPRCKTNLLPLFSESSTDPSMVCHAMKLIKKSIEFLNPG